MSTFSEIKEKVLKYIDVNIRLLKVNFIGRTATLMSIVVFSIFCLFLFCCVILFFGLGLTEVFVAAGVSRVWAFFLTTGIYCFLFALIIALRKNIMRFLSGIFINAMTGDETDTPPAENNDTKKS